MDKLHTEFLSLDHFYFVEQRMKKHKMSVNVSESTTVIHWNNLQNNIKIVIESQLTFQKT